MRRYNPGLPLRKRTTIAAVRCAISGALKMRCTTLAAHCRSIQDLSRPTPTAPSLAQHQARHRAAELLLDTHPCGAHTTASDALWAGRPILTRLGASFQSRVAASLLHAIGLPELVTVTEKQYEALAVTLATDPHRMVAIRDKLLVDRLMTPLFDTEFFTRLLEQAYGEM